MVTCASLICVYFPVFSELLLYFFNLSKTKFYILHRFFLNKMCIRDRGDDRLGAAVAGGVLEQLPQQEAYPFPVGVDPLIQIPGLCPHPALDQQGPVVLEGLVRQLLQACLLYTSRCV